MAAATHAMLASTSSLMRKPRWPAGQPPFSMAPALQPGHTAGRAGRHLMPQPLPAMALQRAMQSGGRMLDQGQASTPRPASSPLSPLGAHGVHWKGPCLKKALLREMRAMTAGWSASL